MQPIQPMQLSPCPGTAVDVHYDLSNIRIGSVIVCVRDTKTFKTGWEYLVERVDGSTSILVKRKGTKTNIKTATILENFKVRVGPVLPNSIARGLMVKAIREGKRYSKGTVITLTECGVKVYDYRDTANKKGAVAHEELLSNFIYL